MRTVWEDESERDKKTVFPLVQNQILNVKSAATTATACRV
jgi:hypothetical protein